MAIAPGAVMINYAARFVETDDRDTPAKVTVRMHNPTELIPSHVDLSNSSEFPTSHYLRFPYVENRQYDVTNITDYDPDSPLIVVSPIATSDPDYSFNIVRVTGWKMDVGEGEKRVHVRYVVP